MIFCELGQTRKGAAVAIDSCARMWLEICHPNPSSIVTINDMNYAKQSIWAVSRRIKHPVII